MRSSRRWVVPVAAVLAVAVAALGAWNVRSRGSDDPPRPEPRSGAIKLELASRPDLRPPEVVVDHGEGGRRDLLFLTPRAGKAREVPGHQQGPLIADDRGRIVWFKPPRGGQPATDFRVQRYRGAPVLTWWQGTMPSRGSGAGKGVIVDSSYRRVATVRAGNGFNMDLHEFLLTPRGTAYITIYARAPHDLKAIGGPENGQVTQGVVQEIDVETGEVLFEWQSIDHVDPAESFREMPESPDQSYDYFHLNSIEEDSRGDLIISARHTSAVYKIDKRTGAVIWRLGGKRSDFEMAPGTTFGAQHDARFDGGDDRIRIFDNVAKADAARIPSNVKLLELDTSAMRATLAERLDHPSGLWAESQANAQRLDDGGLLVGWGSLGAFTRFDREGRHALSGHLPEGYDSYRTFAGRWRGMPRGRPRVAATADGGDVTVHASWNGATRVRAWQLLAGRRRNRLRPAGDPTPWTGLETEIAADPAAPYVAVLALDARGRALATSRAVRAD